jgi:hypothetical protein
MPTLPVPNRCIWCREARPGATFDASHVVPKCVGNEQQILPPGVVCRKCNNYYGSKVEPALLDDPQFHVRAVVLGLVDPQDMNTFRDRLFEARHAPATTPKRKLDLKANIHGSTLDLDVAYTIEGRLTRDYSQRQLKLLSRAIHKIAFEGLAWTVYVKGLPEPPDPFSPAFDPLRAWARRGEPQNSVRPVLRRAGPTISSGWETRVWKHGDDFGVELNLFGDWYAVSATSGPSRALGDLRAWVGLEIEDVWVISDTLSLLPSR